MKTKFTFLLIFCVIIINAQIIDTSFGTNGKITYTNLGEIYGAKISPTGKIILTGSLNNQAVVYRLNEDGSLDSTFGTLGKTIIDDLSFSLDGAESPVFQSDGKIIIVHGVSNNDVNFKERIVRLNSNGTIDNTFSTNYGAIDEYYTEPIIQTDGKILYSAYRNIYRLNSDGSFDVEFGLSGMVYLYNSVNEIILLNYNNTNGDIYYTDKATNGNYNIRKINSYGYSTSADFNVFTDTVVESEFYQNNIYFSTYDYQNSISVNKLFPSLQFVSNFGNNGIATYNTSLDYNNASNEGFTILPDGKIIQTNFDFNASQIEVVKINTNGTLDNTFGVGGKFVFDNSELIDTEFVFTEYNSFNNKLYIITPDVENQKVVITRLFKENLSTNESQKSALKLYPNPTKSTLNFSEELSEIKIVDMSGKQVSSTQSKTKTISVENLPKGNYLITAKDKNGKTISEKFIKE